jgi:hypothetical protein
MLGDTTGWPPALTFMYISDDRVIADSPSSCHQIADECGTELCAALSEAAAAAAAAAEGQQSSSYYQNSQLDSYLILEPWNFGDASFQPPS